MPDRSSKSSPSIFSLRTNRQRVCVCVCVCVCVHACVCLPVHLHVCVSRWEFQQIERSCDGCLSVSSIQSVYIQSVYLCISLSVHLSIWIDLYDWIGNAVISLGGSVCFTQYLWSQRQSGIHYAFLIREGLDGGMNNIYHR